MSKRVWVHLQLLVPDDADPDWVGGYVFDYVFSLVHGTEETLDKDLVEAVEGYDYDTDTEEEGWEEREEHAYWRHRLKSATETAWIRRCGRSRTPGSWVLGIELLEIDEVWGCGIEVYPTRCVLQDGRPRMFGFHLSGSGDLADAWQWRISPGALRRHGRPADADVVRARLDYENMTPAESEQFENLGMCLEERYMSCHVLGSHQAEPPVPEELVKALMALGARKAR